MNSGFRLDEWAVVMPSIRNVNQEFIQYIPKEVKLIIVDDSNGSIACSRANTTIYRYDDYRRILGADEDLIPRKTDTCRSFGFLMALIEGYKYVVTLDDDCRTHPGFLDAYGSLGKKCSVPTVHCPPWYNTLDNLQLNDSESLRWYARGYPYFARSEKDRDALQVTKSTGRVVCNMGLWTNVPDINGLDKVGHHIPSSEGLHQPVLGVGTGTSFSFCIMNAGFLAELVPAFYQLPMSVPIGNGCLDRFGDIWSGYILKKLCDIRGDLITLGEPLVEHVKAGDTVRETRVEHYGHLMESYFYRLIDDAACQTSAADYGSMYGELADNFKQCLGRERLPSIYRDLFSNMANKMIRWSSCTKKALL